MIHKMLRTYIPTQNSYCHQIHDCCGLLLMWQIFLFNSIAWFSLSTHLNQKFTLVQPHTCNYRSDKFCMVREVQRNVTHYFPSVKEPTGMAFHSFGLLNSTVAVNSKGWQTKRTITIVLTSSTQSWSLLSIPHHKEGRRGEGRWCHPN